MVSPLSLRVQASRLIDILVEGGREGARGREGGKEGARGLCLREKGGPR